LGQAAARMRSSCRSQPAIRFQLPLFWSTNFLRSLPLISMNFPRKS
jgi:hypothetical protein